jgi:hypothetical protein
MAYSVEDMLVVVLLLRQPDRLQSVRRKLFHLLRPVGQFPPIQEFDPRGCVSGSRTILLDMSRPGSRVCRGRCRSRGRSLNCNGFVEVRFRQGEPQSNAKGNARARPGRSVLAALPRSHFAHSF